MKLFILTIAGFFLVAAVPTGVEAADSAAVEPEPVKIVASIYPITMLVEEIGGDRVQVSTVVPPGADPHHFELTPSSARAIHEADAILMIGGDFDSWILGDSPPKTRICGAFREVFADSLIELGSTFNPHFWLDPLYARVMSEHIHITLITIDNENRQYYLKRTVNLWARMDSLHAEIKTRVAESGFTSFVSFHPAWTYFARRYGIAEAGVVEKFPEHEPSPRWVADLIREIEKQEVPLMIVEESSNPGVVSGIVHDTGIDVIVLDPIGNPGVPGRETYFGLMDYNLGVIERAMKGD